ncbi:omega-6 fatty acid desaturase, endoplasmic reticulum [Aplysia californica]|uniref:Omega-6 fatty acid desaturase, endoplasmic reticulum n=1 Tax=Aplysia californica TaxID=6500 RepID=A0ABM1VYF9_APLCA|nr:omega-6 fatty acid desaturase, endoplasmic reticulum [Aplysia californica]
MEPTPPVSSNLEVSPGASSSSSDALPRTPWSRRFLMLFVLLQSMHVTSSVTGEETPEADQRVTADVLASPEDDALAKVQLPRKLPSIVEIKKALPSHCFESSVSTSVYYMVRDFILIAMAYYLIEWTWEVFPPIAQVVFTPVFWLVQGTLFTAIFVVGHDAGHGSFSNHEWLNNLCGNLCHSFLMCPFYMWKVSHRRHHKNTGNIDKDEVFFPVRKRYDDKSKVLPGFGLGFGWFGYLAKGYKPRPVHHFNPLDSIFRGHVLQCSISLACLVAWAMCLYRFKEAVGWAVFLYHYGVPLFIFGTYTVIITFLHHTEEDIPWYSQDLWDNVRGQLSSVDRSYGWCHYIIHSIGTHQVHHLFTKVPHYHLEEATAAFRKAFPKLVNIRSDSILPAFWRMFKKYDKQSVIADDAPIHFYK